MGRYEEAVEVLREDRGFRPPDAIAPLTQDAAAGPPFLFQK
jgi:hypothetical protein